MSAIEANEKAKADMEQAKQRYERLADLE